MHSIRSQSSGRMSHPSKNVFRWVYAGWLAFALVVASGAGYTALGSVAYVAMVGVPLFPTLLIARTWVEATPAGLNIRNPLRQTRYDWNDVEELTIEWRGFTRIGRIRLASGDFAWIHAVAGGNRLSQRMASDALESLDVLRSYRPTA